MPCTLDNEGHSNEYTYIQALSTIKNTKEYTDSRNTINVNRERVGTGEDCT